MKNTEIYKFFTLFWELVKRRYEYSDSEAYWETLLDDCNAFGESFNYDPKIQKFAVRVCAAFYDYQGDRLKDETHDR